MEVGVLADFARAFDVALDAPSETNNRTVRVRLAQSPQYVGNLGARPMFKALLAVSFRGGAEAGTSDETAPEDIVLLVTAASFTWQLVTELIGLSTQDFINKMWFIARADSNGTAAETPVLISRADTSGCSTCPAGTYSFGDSISTCFDCGNFGNYMTGPPGDLVNCRGPTALDHTAMHSLSSWNNQQPRQLGFCCLQGFTNTAAHVSRVRLAHTPLELISAPQAPFSHQPDRGQQLAAAERAMVQVPSAISAPSAPLACTLTLPVATSDPAVSGAPTKPAALQAQHG
eukprot:gene11351-11500_t